MHPPLTELDLLDIADRPPPTTPVPAPGGIAFYSGRTTGLMEGTILSVNRARQLGAQLLLAADDWEAIHDATPF